jgi:hypothetical protein
MNVEDITSKKVGSKTEQKRKRSETIERDRDRGSRDETMTG